MPNPVFPVLADDMRPDSSQHEVTFEDPVMESKMDGGYTYTRARHTRTPRKTFRVGYRQLTDAHKAALVAFWNTVRGRSLIFDWVNHEDNLTYAVRFKGDFAFRYTGLGNTKMWDCSFSVEQA